MQTECKTSEYLFQDLGQRKVVGDFSGGNLCSDGGGVLLREVECRLNILKQFAECFVDLRDQDLIEHSVLDLVSQRVYGLALGYEDLNDHDQLRKDPLLALLAGKTDPSGRDRLRKRDQGAPLAGKSTLNRLELTPEDAKKSDRYKKILLDPEAFNQFLIDVFLQAHARPPRQIILDLDATDDPLHGNQEGRFFHGYYKSYCYLPLYIFCGDHLLLAQLRPSNIDAAKGSREEVARIIGRIREVWPEVRIIVRGDSGFCRDDLMTWCEDHGVDYVLGLAQNKRLVKEIDPDLQFARFASGVMKRSARYYKDFHYQTRTSWSRMRRVVGKAEHLTKGANPRFIVTTLSRREMDGKKLYEKLYCARGDMENRIKEQQLYLFADRTSAGTMRANQIRLWFSSAAYLLVSSLRRLGLKETELEKAQCHTIRLKLFKIGVQVRVSVRRVWLNWSSAYPYVALFNQVMENITRRCCAPVPIVS